MIDVSDKQVTQRTAVARGRLFLNEKTIEAIRSRKVRKGDPLQAGEMVAFSAVKRTPDMLPHCHPIPIEHIVVKYDLTDHLLAKVTVKSRSRTGVEMEALMGVNMALITVWDMVKYLEKDTDGQYPDTRIGDVKIIKKKGGEVD